MSDIHDRHPSEDRLQAFLDGEVSSRQRRRIEDHVASCARCWEDLATWRVLFEDLDALGAHGPGPDFAARVMAGVEVREPLPWAARVRARLTGLLWGPEHLSADVLQDLADAALPSRMATRARKHVAGCAVCADELRAWSAVMDRLSGLERFAPAQGFADQVLLGLEAAMGQRTAAAPSAVLGRPLRSRVLAVARRFVPRTRRAWAAISGAAVTPAVTFGLVLWAVFSHPTLTPQALASFLAWQVSDLAVAAWSAVVAGGLEVARFTGLDSFVDAMLQAPAVAALGLALYAVAFTVAVRVLYKNLLISRSVRHRYASASAS